VLAAFAERLPLHQRAHLFSHLPADVRALAEPPRRSGREPKRVRHVNEFIAATGVEEIEPGKAASIVESVLGTLRTLVPDKAEAASAVLPADLRGLWHSAIP
jgi:uncharacterized protein (DUF2267 family)